MSAMTVLASEAPEWRRDLHLPTGTLGQSICQLEQEHFYQAELKATEKKSRGLHSSARERHLGACEFGI